jgi:hypothetical protein
VPRLSRWERAFDKFMSRVIAGAGALTTGVIVGNSSIGPDDIGPATSSGTGLTLGKCGSQVTGKARTDLPLQITAAVPDEPLCASDSYPQIEMTVTILHPPSSESEPIGATPT